VLGQICGRKDGVAFAEDIAFAKTEDFFGRGIPWSEQVIEVEANDGF
jgi:hypothetical protein